MKGYINAMTGDTDSVAAWSSPIGMLNTSNYLVLLSFVRKETHLEIERTHVQQGCEDTDDRILILSSTQPIPYLCL